MYSTHAQNTYKIYTYFRTYQCFYISCNKYPYVFEYREEGLDPLSQMFVAVSSTFGKIQFVTES